MDGSYDEDELGSDVICQWCGELVCIDECEACKGVGTVHNCGEDTCNCADPESQDQVRCQTCQGDGVRPVCGACEMEIQEG
jgi:hypothetical protein